MIIKPKQTTFKGVDYRSMAEAKAAEALDNLGLEFEYESQAARGRQYIGGQYTPDFWVPGLNAYIEVAGVWDERHRMNTAEFAWERGCHGWFTGNRENVGLPIMMHVDGNGYAHPIMPMCENRNDWESTCDEFHSEYVMLGTCGRCGKLFACTVYAKWICPHCGYLNEGDDEMFYERSYGNLFDAAGVKRYGGR